MAVEILVHREGNKLVPHDQWAEEELQSLPNKPLMVTVKAPRSVIHNSLYWLCMSSICKSGGFDDGAAVLHDVTKMSCGAFKVIQLSGMVYRVPDSTAFNKMDQIGFNEYFKRAVAFWQSEGLAAYIEPGLFAKIRDAA